MDAGNENVGVPVVVIIADRDSDVEAGSLEPGLLCDIREGAVAIIAKQPVVVLRRRLFSVAISAPLVKKISGRPSPL